MVKDGMQSKHPSQGDSRTKAWRQGRVYSGKQEKEELKEPPSKSQTECREL